MAGGSSYDGCHGGANYDCTDKSCNGGDGDGDGDCTEVARTLVTALEQDSTASLETSPVVTWPQLWQGWQNLVTPIIIREEGRSKAAGLPPNSIAVAAAPDDDFNADFYSTLNIDVEKPTRRGARLAIRCVANYPGAGDVVYSIGIDDEWTFEIGNVVPSPMDWGARVNALNDYLRIEDDGGGGAIGTNGFLTDAIVPEECEVDTITWEGDVDATSDVTVRLNGGAATVVSLTGGSGELAVSGVSPLAGNNLACQYTAGPVPVFLTCRLWLRKRDRQAKSLKALIRKYTDVPGATAAPTVRWQVRRVSGDDGTINIRAARHDVVQALPVYAEETIANCEVPLPEVTEVRIYDNTVPATPVLLNTKGPGTPAFSLGANSNLPIRVEIDLDIDITYADWALDYGLGDAPQAPLTDAYSPQTIVLTYTHPLPGGVPNTIISRFTRTVGSGGVFSEALTSSFPA